MALTRSMHNRPTCKVSLRSLLLSLFLSQILHTFDASSGIFHPLDNAHLSVGGGAGRAGWTLKYLTSVASD